VTPGRRRRAAGLLFALAAAGCGRKGDVIDWLRMKDQSATKGKPYGGTTAFPDGRVMQTPPEGTVPRERVVGDPLYTDGRSASVYAARSPVPLTRAQLERGQERFRIVCAACHGLLGDGDSEVARNMKLRSPPSLLSPQVRAYPPGRIFSVITLGWGLMPSHRDVLSVDDRWAVVAYLRALQLSQEVPVADLPQADRSAVAAAPAAGESKTP
jgi:mono/diheme cytochrome c family protein